MSCSTPSPRTGRTHGAMIEQIAAIRMNPFAWNTSFHAGHREATLRRALEPATAAADHAPREAGSAVMFKQAALSTTRGDVGRPARKSTGHTRRDYASVGTRWAA